MVFSQIKVNFHLKELVSLHLSCFISSSAHPLAITAFLSTSMSCCCFFLFFSFSLYFFPTHAVSHIYDNLWNRGDNENQKDSYFVWKYNIKHLCDVAKTVFTEKALSTYIRKEGLKWTSQKSNQKVRKSARGNNIVNTTY